jgi:hypothetical protein
MLDRIIPVETISGAHSTGRWMGFRPGLIVLEKKQICCPCRESNHDSSAAQLVA